MERFIEIKDGYGMLGRNVTGVCKRKARISGNAGRMQRDAAAQQEVIRDRGNTEMRLLC